MELEKNKELPEKNNNHSFVKKYLCLSASCPPQCIDTYAPAGAYVDAPSRGATLGAFICGLNSFNNASQWLNSFFSVNLW